MFLSLFSSSSILIHYFIKLRVPVLFWPYSILYATRTIKDILSHIKTVNIIQPAIGTLPHLFLVFDVF